MEIPQIDSIMSLFMYVIDKNVFVQISTVKKNESDQLLPGVGGGGGNKVLDE